MALKDGIATQVLLREKYDTLYGIFNFDEPPTAMGQPPRPLALVALHEKERYMVHTSLYAMMERFVRYKVKERSGLNWLEFINQPRDMVERWFDICRAEQEREVNDPNVRREERQLEQAERLLGKGRGGLPR